MSINSIGLIPYISMALSMASVAVALKMIRNFKDNIKLHAPHIVYIVSMLASSAVALHICISTDAIATGWYVAIYMAVLITFVAGSVMSISMIFIILQHTWKNSWAPFILLMPPFSAIMILTGLSMFNGFGALFFALALYLMLGLSHPIIKGIAFS